MGRDGNAQLGLGPDRTTDLGKARKERRLASTESDFQCSKLIELAAPSNNLGD
jgi:hypothetical protein